MRLPGSRAHSDSFLVEYSACGVLRRGVIPPSVADGVPVQVVSERLGHASASTPLMVYQHVHPGMGRQAADRFAALLER